MFISTRSALSNTKVRVTNEHIIYATHIVWNKGISMKTGSKFERVFFHEQEKLPEAEQAYREALLLEPKPSSLTVS